MIISVTMRMSHHAVVMQVRKNGVTVMLFLQCFLTISLLCFLHHSDLILQTYYGRALPVEPDVLENQQSSSVGLVPSNKDADSKPTKTKKIILTNTQGRSFVVPFHDIPVFDYFNKKEQEEKKIITSDHKEKSEAGTSVVYPEEDPEEHYKTVENQGEIVENQGIIAENQGQTGENQGQALDNQGETVENVENQGEPVENQGESIENQGEPVENQGESIENKGEPVENQGENIEYQGEPVQNQGEPVENQGEPVENQGESVENQGETGENQQDANTQNQALPMEGQNQEQEGQSQDQVQDAQNQDQKLDSQKQDQSENQPAPSLEQSPQYQEENQEKQVQEQQTQILESQEQNSLQTPEEQNQEQNSLETQEQQNQEQNLLETQEQQNQEQNPLDTPEQQNQETPEQQNQASEQQQQPMEVQEGNGDSNSNGVNEGGLPVQDRLPTLYEVYGSQPINSGLTYQGTQFLLNRIPIRIQSGAIHYFRVHPLYWRDRLRKLKASGLNTVETYIAWNLHEPQPGKYNFEDGFLDIKRFITLAKEEGLLVILRPGPYICAEWEFGGIPSWILRNDSVRVRTTHTAYLSPALRYVQEFAKRIVDLVWSPRNGAQPIIGIQVENEYPIFPEAIQAGKNYINFLKKHMERHGLRDIMYFVSNPIKQVREETLFPDIVQTINFGNLPDDRLNELQRLQPNKPLMVMEFWTGWFDNWLEPHKKFDVFMFKKNLHKILARNASVNLYMFHGGTNFGFMNGAYIKKDKISYRPVVSSYDYDALLTESGSYTSKYFALKDALKLYPFGPQIQIPDPPEESHKRAYPKAYVRYYCPLEDIITSLAARNEHGVQSPNPIPVELLGKIGASPQSYGYILYRKRFVRIFPNSILKIKGLVKDILYVLLDGELVTNPLSPQQLGTYPPYMDTKDPQIILPGKGKYHQLDLFVENMGRMNVGGIHQERKGIYGRVLLDNRLLQQWTIYPIDLKNDMFPSVNEWKPYVFDENSVRSPALYRAVLETPSDEQPCDTYVNLAEGKWTKGQIYVNGFNLGRYWNLGPTKTSYVPAPLLKPGNNEIVIFELFEPGRSVSFDDHPNLG